MISFPVLIIYLWYIISGYLYSLICQLEWLALVIGFLVLPMVKILLTPQLCESLKRKFRPDRRIHPKVTMNQNEPQQRNFIGNRHYIRIQFRDKYQ